MWTQSLEVLNPYEALKVNKNKTNKFFKIAFPNGKSIVVVSKNGYAGLIDLVDGVEDKENTYIIPISFFEFIKYLIK